MMINTYNLFGPIRLFYIKDYCLSVFDNDLSYNTHIIHNIAWLFYDRNKAFEFEFDLNYHTEFSNQYNKYCDSLITSLIAMITYINICIFLHLFYNLYV